MKKILLDTNAYSKYLCGDEKVLEFLAYAEITYMPVIVIGELHAGFKGGSKESENRKKLGKFLDKPTVEVLNVTEETAEIFGEIKDSLRKAGTPIPVNDIWIAALGKETGSVIITYDSHFEQIAGLRLWDGLFKTY